MISLDKSQEKAIVGILAILLELGSDGKRAQMDYLFRGTQLCAGLLLSNIVGCTDEEADIFLHRAVEAVESARRATVARQEPQERNPITGGSIAIVNLSFGVITRTSSVLKPAQCILPSRPAQRK